MSEFRLDRILQEDEIKQLNDLLVPKLKNDYPNFEKWLVKAQEEIAEGTRVAIGIWKEKLIATSIVKMTASKTAELKSLFVDPDFRNQGYGDFLYEETEMQCRKAGVTRIITDTYVDNKAMVEFLISKGFLVAGKEDLYGNGRYSYILSKALNPEYFGDPYDWEGLGEWYLGTRLNAFKIKDHPLVNGRKFDRHMRIFLGDYSLGALVEVKDQRVDSDIVEILHKKCNESNYHLAIFVAREFTERAKKYAMGHGVIIFDNEDMAKVLGYRPPQFREGPISGMVVAIKPAYLTRILNHNPPYYYVKGGPIGKFLKKGHRIVFYATEPEKNITTLGKVESTKIGSPSEIWDSIGDKLVFTKEEFFRFASIKQEILAIELSEFQKIPPLAGKKLDSMIPQNKRGGSYMDEKTIEKVLKNK